MKQFNVAIIGSGNISQMHFDAYQPHSERIKVVAACDIDATQVDRVCKKYGVPHGFSSLEEMIAQTEWEIGIVCTPTNVRRQVVETLAAAGKHIFVEKPFADTYEDAQQMVNVCERAGVGIAVNQNFRYHYPFDVAREVVRQGEIGRVVNILHQDLMFRQDGGWRTQQKRHAMSVMGVHWLDGMRWLLDDEAVTLKCETRSSAAIVATGETEASVQINFNRGTLATYIESFSSPIQQTQTVIFGEKGGLVLTYDGASLFNLDNRATPVRQWENPYRGSNKPAATYVGLNQFLTALEQGGEPENSGRDNLKTIALLDGAYLSAEEQRIVTFSEGIPI